MAINKNFKNLLSKDDIKFTIILGSGFHRQALGNNSILSNWEILLSRLTHSKNITGDFNLDFEKIVLDQFLYQKDNTKAAHYVERDEKNKLVSFLNQEQAYVLKESNRFKYPNIFHSSKISDIVSLNFDTIPEHLCNPDRKKPKKENKSSFNKVKNSDNTSQTFTAQITSFEEIKLQNESIRFWHPHGSIDKPSSIVLGVSKYAELVKSSIQIRNHYKAFEEKGRSQELKELTWLSQIYNNPVLILGASMSHIEWAMWTAIVHRNRNFAKQENKKCEKPIFIMMSPEDLDNRARHQWFEPLFSGLDFKEQWTELEKLFKSK